MPGFSLEVYIEEIIRQKGEKRYEIISNYKSARKSYQEFKIQEEKLQDKMNESEIIEYLKSDDIEVFFKSFSMKDKFNKSSLAKFNILELDLASTNWFKTKMKEIFNIE